MKSDEDKSSYLDRSQEDAWRIKADLAAARVQTLLEARGIRLVLAESCTAGSISAALATLPGISQSLCGCFVVYRNDSKSKWLGLSSEALEDPEIGSVSQLTSDRLARACLQATPEASISLAVTGDVGPGAPDRTDGWIFLSCCYRDAQISSKALQLSTPRPRNARDIELRRQRLQEATALGLEFLVDSLS
jgi:nicotinamide-nucleotide amidase